MGIDSRLQRDLDYVASTVRRRDRQHGVPSIYFLWAAIIAVGFALPDFAPRHAAAFWLVAGIGGGLLSWWLGARDGWRRGVNDVALGRRHGLHWLVAGAGFLLCWLPVLGQGVPMSSVAASFMLVAGLAYAFAGVHLQRPLLWSGLVMLAAYAILALRPLPYTWTFAGAAIAVALAVAGWCALRAGGREDGGRGDAEAGTAG